MLTLKLSFCLSSVSVGELALLMFMIDLNVSANHTEKF